MIVIAVNGLVVVHCQAFDAVAQKINRVNYCRTSSFSDCPQFLNHWRSKLHKFGLIAAIFVDIDPAILL